MNFKAFCILEFEDENIKSARQKLKQIVKDIKTETLVDNVYLDMEKERLFELGDVT